MKQCRWSSKPPFVGAAAPARLGEAEGSNVLPRGQAGQVLGLLLLGASNQDPLQKQAQETLQHHPVGKQRQLTSSSMFRKLHFYGIVRDSLINNRLYYLSGIKIFFISIVCSIPRGIFSCCYKLSVVSSFFLPSIHPPLKGKYLWLY